MNPLNSHRTLALALLMSACLSQPAGAVGTEGLAALSGIVQVDAGDGHTCALTAEGGVKCWGDNTYGQLGTNSTASRAMPGDVVGLSSGVAAIAAGGGHTCALTTDGAVKCWGSYDTGYLFDDESQAMRVPVDVPGLASGIVAIAAGSQQTCALSQGGEVKCWGYALVGPYGNTTSTGLNPVAIPGLESGVVAVAAGNYHTCALTNFGGVKCWGGDPDLIGTTYGSMTPVDVAGLANGVIAITAGGGHTCALTNLGGVKCWGYGDSGQLGDGARQMQTTPVDVVGLGSGVAAIAAGSQHTCALATGGGVKCWGYNAFGQIGDATIMNRATPVEVVGLADAVVAIAAGANHTCAVGRFGDVMCWGHNFFGQLGDDSTSQHLEPVDVVGLSSAVKSIEAGSGHTCAVTSSGAARCWGNNDYGQLGDGSTANRATPVDVVGLAGAVVSISAGGEHTCALTEQGGVKCWGWNYYGQVGDSSIERLAPVDVQNLSGNVAAIAAGAIHTCALTSDGEVKCWGANTNGQLGDGSTANRFVPLKVAEDVKAIATGSAHTCALTSGGAVKCWGNNTSGQLGDGTSQQRNSPVDVSGLSSGVAAISAGGSHTCALTTAGRVTCWGNNGVGQLGNAPSGPRTMPVDVNGQAGAMVAIAAGSSHTCAITSAGGVRCWGSGYDGQLGNDSTANRSTPIDVSGLATGAVAIAAGSSHSCALTVAGGVKCWGSTRVGLLGDGGFGGRSTPGFVLIGPDAQGISLSAAPDSLIVGGSATLSATTSSGLPVVFSSLTPSVCRVMGDTVVGFAAGICTIVAYQAGDAVHAVAQVMHSFPVTQAESGPQLTAAKVGPGTGTITSVPAGIDCGATCTAGFEASSSVTLVATPAADSEFAGWFGACGGMGACTVTMDEAQTVGATFRLKSGNVVAVPTQLSDTVALAQGGVTYYAGRERQSIAGPAPREVAALAVVRMDRSLNDGAGGPDSSWGEKGIARIPIWGEEDTATAIAIQPDGKIVVLGNAPDPAEREDDYGGAAYTFTRHYYVAVVRLNSDGTIDRNFGRMGHVTFRLGPVIDGLDDSEWNSPDGLRVLEDGRIVVSHSGDNGSTYDAARILPDGTLEAGFAPFADFTPRLAAWEAVIEFVNAHDQYFLTSNPVYGNELDRGLQGPWYRTGYSFHSFASQGMQVGTVPVCQFHGNEQFGLGNYFYTADPGECAFLSSDTAHPWILETAEAFRMALPDPATGACAALQRPVYRFVTLRGDSAHRFTISWRIKTLTLANGWIPEGLGPDRVAMCAAW